MNQEQLRLTLSAAKQVLLSEGWTQHRGVRRNGDGYAFCLSGAIGVVHGATIDTTGIHPELHSEGAPRWHAFGIPVRFVGITTLVASLMHQHGYIKAPVADYLVLWNDEPQRTLEDVIAMLDLLILSLAPAASKPEQQLEPVPA